MLEQDERIAKFLDAIDRDAQERRRQIEAQVDQANAEALERAKAEAQAQAQQLISVWQSTRSLLRKRPLYARRWPAGARRLPTRFFWRPSNRSVHLRKNLNIRPSSPAVRHAVRRSFRRGSRQCFWCARRISRLRMHCARRSAAPVKCGRMLLYVSAA